MYFEVEGSSVRIGGTMHCIPKGLPLAHWVHGALNFARVIYLEHDKEESDRGRYAPSGSPPLAQRLPHAWPRIERKYLFDRFRMDHLSGLRPFAVASDVLDLAPIDPGVELLAIARSKESHPPGPHLKYLETAAQSDALTDGVSDSVWDNAVSWALDDPGSFKQVLESSYRAWVAGDFEEVDRISTLRTRNRFGPIKNALIISRNARWLPIIREVVESANEPTLILVGAAHLGGSDGLLPQLAAGGLRLTSLASLTG